jgi:MazG family protein
MSNVSESFLRLVSIMDELREKCPWDQKQTVDSLRHMTIEETYELAEAITDKDWQGIKEELGDLLLHILFYSRIAKEQNKFTLEEVIHGIAEKLIARHPHIYPSASSGLVQVRNEEDVKKNWEKLKLKEGKKSVLSGVPASLPATVKAIRLQEKARQVGFEWQNKDQVWQKVEEEIKELHSAVEKEEKDKVEDEFGDLVFSLINYARFLQIDAENALERTNKKFISRFTKMEAEALKQSRKLDQMTLDEMDAIWNAIKHQQNS